MDPYAKYPGLSELKVSNNWKSYIVSMLDESPVATERRIVPNCEKFYHPGVSCN